MEGFLLKKGRNSTFGRKSWKKRWFILEDQKLSYFDDFSVETGLPTSPEKGSVDLTGAEVTSIPDEAATFSFVIKLAQESPFYLQAPDARTLSMWIKAISTAARGKIEKPVIDLPSSYSLLGLDINSHLTSADVNRAYRKKALKSHPDKGGDIAVFEKIQEAFDAVTAHLEENEAAKLFENRRFEAVIQKGGQGVGLGMIVVEDVAKNTIKVKDVLPGIIIKSLTAGASGSIKKDDVLVKVGNDDVTHMPLSRVIQKLNDFRVPVNSTIKLTLVRKMRKDGSPILDDDSGVSRTSVDTPDSQSINRRASASNNSGLDGGGHNHYDTPMSNTAVSSPDYSTPGSRQPRSFVGSAEHTALVSENEKLKLQLDQSVQLLRKEQRDREVLHQNYIEQAALLAQRNRYIELLEVQLEQSYIFGSISSDQMVQSLKDMMAVSSVVQAHKPLPLSKQTDEFLVENGLSADDAERSIFRMSQRSAIAATAAVDKSGMMVKKWQLAGDSILDKLNQFENSIRNFESEIFATGKNEELAKYQPPVVNNISKQQMVRSPSRRVPATGSENNVLMRQSSSSGPGVIERQPSSMSSNNARR
jgi:hypothetical protein